MGWEPVPLKQQDSMQDQDQGWQRHQPGTMRAGQAPMTRTMRKAMMSTRTRTRTTTRNKGRLLLNDMAPTPHLWASTHRVDCGGYGWPQDPTTTTQLVFQGSVHRTEDWTGLNHGPPFKAQLCSWLIRPLSPRIIFFCLCVYHTYVSDPEYINYESVTFTALSHYDISKNSNNYKSTSSQWYTTKQYVCFPNHTSTTSPHYITTLPPPLSTPPPPLLSRTNSRNWPIDDNIIWASGKFFSLCSLLFIWFN